MWEYWAKSDADGAWHSLPFHQLDVAAVGVRLLQRHPGMANRLLQLSGLPRSVFETWIAFFLALHDLGKFSSNFQMLRPDLAPAHCRQRPSSLRHDSMGNLLWQERIGPELVRSGKLVRTNGSSDDIEELLDGWVSAVTGHHGQPPKSGNHPLAACFATEDIEAASEFVGAIATFLLQEHPPELSGDLLQLVDRSRPFSWWLAGFAVLADWLGSNRDFFPYRTEPMSLLQYWEKVAFRRADDAIDACGLLPAPPASDSQIQKLFPRITTPTPLQDRCARMPLSDGPQLMILEDVTGAGKTEAAFVLLNRLLASGKAEGGYFALPTMATSNAMYLRAAGVYKELFDERSSAASLILAHGSRHLDQRFRISLLPRSPDQGEYQPGELDAGARCNSWLADGNKRALLAQMGVGTIDQALLAILTSRHQSLRLLGLGNKVLIVDEVHASDAYMHRLLCSLLQFHAYMGGSAVLLSATLPARMRQELADAFRRGLGQNPQPLSSGEYPLVTRIDHSQQPLEIQVETRGQCRRTVEFSTFQEPAMVMQWIVEQARAGRCVTWIRNTVGDAILARQALAREIPEENLDLFHARFAMGDRLAIENRVLARFGPESTPKDRAGRVLIATQVVEQSLDLDFDCMISDLAPIDLLLQRAGRLRRHVRDELGNRQLNDATDRRGPITLHVLMPDPGAETDKRWVSGLLPGTAAVYPDHAQLWLTAWMIEKWQRLKVPEELRLWIEGVFSDDPAATVPEALAAIGQKAEGVRRGDSATATFNSIRLEDGYEQCYGEWWDESHTPTRLGEPTVVVRLARWDGQALKPWSNATEYPWAFSEVRVRRSVLASEEQPGSELLRSALEKVRESWSKSAAHSCVLPLENRDGVWRCKAMDESGRSVEVTYHADEGLTIERMKQG